MDDVRDFMEENYKSVISGFVALAGTVFMYRWLSNKNSNIEDKEIKKRRLILKRMKKFFCTGDENLSGYQLDNMVNRQSKYGKLKNYTEDMLIKIVDEKTEKKFSGEKKDYIFYQIMLGLEKRFKTKELIN